VNAVALHQIWMTADSLQQKWNQDQVVLSCQTRVDILELMNISGSVVTRKSHSREHDFRALALQRLDHLLHVGFGYRRRNAAKTIIAA